MVFECGWAIRFSSCLPMTRKSWGPSLTLAWRLRPKLISTPPKNSPMFRFTIRELVLVTLVVALALGWSIDHVSLRNSENQLHGLVHEMAVDWSAEVGHAITYPLPSGGTLDVPPPSPAR